MIQNVNWGQPELFNIDGFFLTGRIQWGEGGRGGGERGGGRGGGGGGRGI